MIIFLCGGDNFRSFQKLVAIKDKFQKSGDSVSGVALFDFSEKALAENVLESFGARSLFSSKRLVIVKNLVTFGLAIDKEKIKKYLQENSQNLAKENDLVVVFFEGSAPRKNDSLFKFFSSSPEIKSQSFEKLSGLKLNQWIQEKIKNINLATGIATKALEKLVFYVGNETAILDKEIEKLASFSCGKEISEQDVENLVRANIDSNIFATVDALGRNDKKMAVKLLQNHYEKGDDPFYLLSMFVYQFRNLLKVADLWEKRYPELEIIRATKMNPYVVKKSLTQARNFSLGKLKKIYQELSLIDQRVKTGKAEIKLALFKFVAEI